MCYRPRYNQRGEDGEFSEEVWETWSKYPDFSFPGPRDKELNYSALPSKSRSVVMCCVPDLHLIHAFMMLVHVPS